MSKSFRNKLDNSTVLGTWVVTSSPQHCEIIGHAGFDFQILDMEHGTVDFSICEDMIRACELSGCFPLVRLPKIDVTLAQRFLDRGVGGVIYPQVHSAADVKEAVETLMYPPKGKRGFNPFTRQGNFGHPSSEEFDQHPLRAIILENQKTLAELDAILDIDDLDLIYLGTYDMSVDMGIPSEMRNPKLLNLVDDAVVRIRKANKSVGVMVHNQEDMKHMIELGANFLVQTVDTEVIHSAFSKIREEFDDAKEK